MNARMDTGTIRYQKNLVMKTRDQLTLARQEYISYRTAISRYYASDELSYLIIAINTVLEKLYRMIDRCTSLLDQFSYIERNGLGRSNW